jgi:hypothetical protein
VVNCIQFRLGGMDYPRSRAKDHAIGMGVMEASVNNGEAIASRLLHTLV